IAASLLNLLRVDRTLPAQRGPLSPRRGCHRFFCSSRLAQSLDVGCTPALLSPLSKVTRQRHNGHLSSIADDSLPDDVARFVGREKNGQLADISRAAYKSRRNHSPRGSHVEFIAEH